jgi:hypothetical protein
MACSSCKKNGKLPELKVEGPQTSWGKFKYFTIKFLIFLVSATFISIIIIPVMIVVLFREIVLSKNINLYPLLVYIGKKIFPKEEEPEEIDEDDFDEDDYELEDKYEVVRLN